MSFTSLALKEKYLPTSRIGGFNLCADVELLLQPIYLSNETSSKVSLEFLETSRHISISV